jgi:hypothetical protein
MAEQHRFAFCSNYVENLMRLSFNGISFLPPTPSSSFLCLSTSHRAPLPVCQPPNAIMYK